MKRRKPSTVPLESTAVPIPTAQLPRRRGRWRQLADAVKHASDEQQALSVTIPPGYNVQGVKAVLDKYLRTPGVSVHVWRGEEGEAICWITGQDGV